VKERVAAHAALETSQEQVLALQRNELLSRLASSVAHDFNNLLTVMVAEATFLRESEDEAARESAALIHEAAKQGTALTRQLLLLSRHDVAQKAVVDAGASARGIERTIRRLMPAHVHLEVSSPESPCPVVIDETHLQQALMNLALNARDAIAREGRIQVSVARLDAPPPGAHRRDGTPVGMDEATRKRALEPFFTTKDRGKGTGLGLSTVLSVVEGNGGWLDLASDPGRGTSVSLYFPEADAAAIESRQGDWLRPPPSQPRRVLLADDNEGVRQTLVRALEGAGHHVTVTSDAGAAIRALDEARVPFDAVVSDGVMPQGSGLDVLVHAARVAPGARRVLITGYLELDTSAVEFHGSGFTVLKKPFQPEDLLAALDAEVPRSER
jgi:CheY-like chemotaxis protein